MVENNEEIQIRQINFKSIEYTQEFELRNKVLRTPLGMSLYDENLEAEKNDVHIGAFMNDIIVGVLILTEINNTEIKMRQVAVDEEWRSKRIGKKMVDYAEIYSKSRSFTIILLNARKTAVEFYEKLGYEKISDEFLEINLPHYKMRKKIQ